MAEVVAYLPRSRKSVLVPITERNDLTKPPTTRYLLRSGDFDVYRDRPQAEALHRELDCLLGDLNAHDEARCLHSQHA